MSTEQKHTRNCTTEKATYEVEIQLSKEKQSPIYTVYVGVSAGLSKNIIEAEAKIDSEKQQIINLFSTGETREYEFNPAEEALENILPDYPIEKAFPNHKQLSEKVITELQRLL